MQHKDGNFDAESLQTKKKRLISILLTYISFFIGVKLVKIFGAESTN